MKKKRRYLRWSVIILGVLAIVYFASAWIMVSLPMPEVPPEGIITKQQALDEGMIVEQFYEFETYKFTMRDEAVLTGARYAAPSKDTLLFLHGASGYSSQLNNSIGKLQEATGIEVFTYDHRGHGNSPGKRGDLEHVDQYATDLADVLKAIHKQKPEGKIILAGHSMGGGIIQRYAMSAEPNLADAYLLFAPALGRGVPGETTAKFLKLHMPRIIGIAMLNLFGIERFDHLPVVNLGFAEFDGHINQYTFNGARSMVPADWKEGISALQKPCLVFLGGSDTAKGVAAEDIAALIEKHSDAEVIVIPDEGHHVQNHDDAITSAVAWIKEIIE